MRELASKPTFQSAALPFLLRFCHSPSLAKAAIALSLAQSPDGKVDAVVVLELGAEAHVIRADVVEVSDAAAILEGDDLEGRLGPVPVATHLPQDLQGMMAQDITDLGTASLSHLRTMLPETSSCPQPAQRPIHAN